MLAKLYALYLLISVFTVELVNIQRGGNYECKAKDCLYLSNTKVKAKTI